MRDARKHIAIIGGGVIGLSLAWRLAQQGCEVSVFERGQCGREASWAAAGMLAAAGETGPGQEAFFALARASREMWADFATELEAAANMAIGYRPGETLVTAHTDAEADHLRATAKHLHKFNEPVRLLTTQMALALENTLSDDVQLALLSPKDGQVDNRALGQALLVACSGAGVRIFENSDVQKLDCADIPTPRLLVDGELVSFDAVVVAAGAWSSPFLTETARGAPPIRPVKGQMLALETSGPTPKHIIWSAGVYIVPRANGRIIIGATMEDAGFDMGVVEDAIEEQFRCAVRAVPSLEDAEIVDTWAGIRPGTPDDLPLMGPTSQPGVWAATGHFRNGILLAPITGELMAQAVMEGVSPAPLVPFLPNRFD